MKTSQANAKQASRIAVSPILINIGRPGVTHDGQIAQHTRRRKHSAQTRQLK
jgi:hypothetical protein